MNIRIVYMSHNGIGNSAIHFADYLCEQGSASLGAWDQQWSQYTEISGFLSLYSRELGLSQICSQQEMTNAK